MTSQIDATKPVIGNPTTESVRQNFAIASAEISDLQDMLDNLELMLAGYLPLTGGQLTGPLLLAGDPTDVLGAVPKQYADRKLALTGGTLTGPLILAADATTALGAATKQQVDLRLALSGGTMTGPITGLQVKDGIGFSSTTINDPAWLFSLKLGTADRASLTGNNVVLDSWNGIGFGNNGVAGQRVPAGMQGIWFNVRTGGILNTGTINGRSTVVNDSHRFGAARIYRDSSNNTVIGLTPGAYFMSLDGASPIANGGSGINPNDRFYDAYDNLYTVLTTDVPNGAATGIRIDFSPYTATVTLPNPIALTPCPGFFGAGLAVNLVTTLAPKLLINVGNGQTLEFAAASGINFVNAVTMTGSLTTNQGMTSGSNTTNGGLTINGPLNSSIRSQYWQTAGANRWRWYLANTESADAGCDLYLTRYNDAGVATIALLVARATGVLTVLNGLQINNTANLVFQNSVVTTTNDLTKHLQLYAGYGLCMTSGRMNFVSSQTWFVTAGGVDIGQINAGGLNSFPIGASVPAAGTFTSVKTGSITGPTWTTGTGAPAATAPVGSIYSRTDGTAGARLYVSAGAGTWTPVATV